MKICEVLALVDHEVPCDQPHVPSPNKRNVQAMASFTVASNVMYS